jgi:E3 ubiquitin-protein transferase RMND5
VKLLDITNNRALRKQLHLINRAIAMHLLREGQFRVASTFMREGKEGRPLTIREGKINHLDILSLSPTQITSPPGLDLSKSEALQSQFQKMYDILRDLRVNRNLKPAIEWAAENSDVLESRGSNLYFDLCRLRFIQLFSGDESASESPNPADGPLRATSYARSAFMPFKRRYAAEINQLTGALAFWENLADSPYKSVFQNSSAWDEAASSFTKEFCSLLGLSADSPLYVAATAGAIALPLLAKARVLMKINKTDWTTAEEMPVRITYCLPLHCSCRLTRFLAG